MNTADDIDTLQIGPDPDKLERFHRQQLSAMLDGELSQDQARFLRRRLEHDAELSSCFERWQVCGDVLRGRQVSLLPPDFAERIARGIADGDVTIAPVATARRPRLLRWGGGAALAASVALVALFVGRPGASFDTADDALPMTAATTPVATPPVASTDATADASPLAAAPADATAAAALAGAAALAVAEVPRRGNGERASRGQSQRAALRNTQNRQAPAARMVASAAPPRAAEAPVSLAAAATSASVATGLPEAPAIARPWPRASSLSANSSFSVRYGESFDAPSWDAPQVSGSSVLPSFPVDPADAARPQLRAVP